jgi:hypothetical protein
MVTAGTIPKYPSKKLLLRRRTTVDRPLLLWIQLLVSIKFAKHRTKLRLLTVILNEKKNLRRR